MKYFHTVEHVQLPSFPKKKKKIFLELTTFIISTLRDIYTKLLTFSKRSAKEKVISRWVILVILLTSAVICKQRLVHGNDTVKYFQHYKWCDVDRDHFRKRFYSSTKFTKKPTLKRPMGVQF